MKTLQITPIELENHLLNNSSLDDYNMNSKRELFIYDGLKLKIDLDKIDSFLMPKIQKNFELANERINKKLSISAPTVGDFFIVDGQYYRIALNAGDKEFQYTKGGSFYLTDLGNCDYSGGFSFDHGSRFKYSDLEITDELKEGNFWLFSNNTVKAHNGVHFDMNFKVWKLK